MHKRWYGVGASLSCFLGLWIKSHAMDVPQEVPLIPAASRCLGKSIYQKGVSLEESHEEGEDHFVTQPFCEPLLVPSDPPEGRSEAVLALVKPGEDARKLFLNTDEWPFCAFGEVSAKFRQPDDSPYRLRASGFLVGPHHVLTAAHNLYRNGCWAEEVEFIPGRKSATDSPYSSKGSLLLVPQAWCQREYALKRATASDFGLIILDQPIGQQLGWFGLAVLSDRRLSETKLLVLGYPEKIGISGGAPTRQPNCTELWGVPQAYLPKSVDPDFIRYVIDTSEGQSGSPVLGCFESPKQQGNLVPRPFVVGVHTFGGRAKGQGVNPDDYLPNIALRFTTPVVKTIVSWIEQYQLEGSLKEWQEVRNLLRQPDRESLESQEKLIKEVVSSHQAFFRQEVHPRQAKFLKAFVRLPSSLGMGGLFMGVVGYGIFLGKPPVEKKTAWGIIAVAGMTGVVAGLFYKPFEKHQMPPELENAQMTLLHLKRKAEKGDAEACYYLALSYYRDKKLGKQMGRAREWARRAQEAGYQGAQDLLKFIEKEGSPQEKGSS